MQPPINNSSVEYLRLYMESKSEPGSPYKPTERDKICSDIASKYTEAELRGAVVMSALYARKHKKKKV